MLRPYLDIFCTVYINNILVYSNTWEDHQKYVCLVLEACTEAGLQLDINKCKFFKTEIIYLGFIISIDRIKINFKKIEVVMN